MIHYHVKNRLVISIHALREEGDSLSTGPTPRMRWYFYPRPPRGGRLFSVKLQFRVHTISIHALREEGDGHGPGRGSQAGDFYPRPPRGGRQAVQHRQTAAPHYFYPRPPRGGRLSERCCIHQRNANFYPRPPRGGRLLGQRSLRQAFQISIHALREEGDF